MQDTCHLAKPYLRVSRCRGRPLGRADDELLLSRSSTSGMATKLSFSTFLTAPALLSPGQKKFGVNLQPLITCQLDNFTSFSSSLGTDLPLRQHPQVSFQSYLQDRQRIFEAIFPDKKRCEKLNEQEWRIYMLPLDFLFLSVNPVVDMRILVQPPSLGLPLKVSKDVDRVLTLEATKWELRGLDYVMKPSDFSLSVKGVLFSEQRGVSLRLRGHLQMNVKMSTPPSLAVIPQDIVKSVGEAVLTRLLDSMKEKVNNKLLEDYKAYAQEKASSSRPKLPTPSV